MSLSSLFEIGRRSLAGYQSAIDTTTGNIANANNEGYTRRRVDLSYLSSNQSGITSFGTGVNGTDLQRMRQRFAEYSLWRENNNLGKFEKTESLLKQIESVLGSEGDGSIQSVLNEFWSAWNDLANDPESTATRALVKNKGQLLTDTFNNAHNRMIQMQRELTPEINETVNTVNQISNQLLAINQQLKINQSPDLMDSRDQLITDLSKIINIEVKEKDNGEVSILFGGHILISENKANPLQAKFDATDNVHSVSLTFKDSNYEPEIQGGSLAGLMDVYNNNIPNYLNQLDTLAVNIVQGVNSVHSAGYNIAGTTGINFFDPNVSGASSFRMNNAVVNDPNLIASRSATEGIGANSIAESIFNLQNSTFVANETPSDFYTSLVTEIGTDISDAEFQRSSQELITQQLQNQRDEITGVSLDEEMTKLILYEQSYQAAAKIITTVDQMMDTVLSLR